MPVLPPSVIRQIDHVALRVRDVAAIQALYCDVPGYLFDPEANVVELKGPSDSRPHNHAGNMAAR